MAGEWKGVEGYYKQISLLSLMQALSLTRSKTCNAFVVLSWLITLDSLLGWRTCFKGATYPVEWTTTLHAVASSSKAASREKRTHRFGNMTSYSLVACLGGPEGSNMVSV